MEYLVVLGVFIILGILIYLSNKKYKKPKLDYIIDKDYISEPSDLTLFESKLRTLIDIHRLNINQDQIPHTDKVARELAEEHCRYMREKGIASHDNFLDRSNKIKSIGALFCGEIVAFGFTTAQSIFNGYLKSPPHRKMIETSGVTHVGIRALTDRKGRFYNTIIFYK